jgi:hypothetical protein
VNSWLKEMSSDLVNSSNEDDQENVSLFKDSNIQEIKNEKKMSKKQKTKLIRRKEMNSMKN